MELLDLDFTYEIKGRKFSHFSYTFNILFNLKSKEEITEIAKRSLQNLEQTLDKHYSKEEFEKTEDGEINSYKIKFGYKYSNHSFRNLPYRDLRSSSLKYNLGLNQKGELKDSSLNLINMDSNPQKILTLHDEIIVMPNLKISDKSQIKIERINSLREEGFELNSYLTR